MKAQALKLKWLICCLCRGSVSRTIKLINEVCADCEERPPDWFSQKNCAIKYNELLATASATK